MDLNGKLLTLIYSNITSFLKHCQEKRKHKVDIIKKT